MSNQQDEQPAPAALGKAGIELWNKLSALFKYDAHEALILQRSAELEDQIVRLRDELADADLIVPGSLKQPVESPLLTSYRAATALQAKLLGTLVVNDESGAFQTDRSTIARRNALKRWNHN